MAMDFSRRELITAGAAYLCGFPAMAAESSVSLNTMLDEVNAHLVGHHNSPPQIDATNWIPGSELHDLVLGKSAYGTTSSGKVYALAFQENGVGLLKIEGWPLEAGQWWITDTEHTIHSRWPDAADGEALNLYYRQLDDGLFASRSADGRRYSYFFLGDTPPELVAD